MATGLKVLYEFGPFRVDPDKQLLLRQGCPVDMTPKAFETLLALIRHSREVVTKDELMKAVWPDTIVEEANLSQNIFVIRKALGETPEDHRYIVTIPGRGYRFATEVRSVTEGSEPLLVASRSRSQVLIEQTESVLPETLPALSQGLHRKALWKFLFLIGGPLGLLILGAVFLLLRHKPAPLGEKDFVLVADFTNTTDDPVFDGTLRQGLEVQVEQSPHLSLVSEQRIQHTLRLMGQPADAQLTPRVAQEVCERIGSVAVLTGSISSLGSQYVLGLTAKDCLTGDVLAEEQMQAAKKGDVLKALSRMATTLRSRLGESLSTIREHDTPLPEATTPSLEALKAYSAAWRAAYSSGAAAALPLFERAVQIDTRFAVAYAALGRMYADLDEPDLAAENITRAWQLRERASDRERFFINGNYDMLVIGNLEKARQNDEAWVQTYPHDPVPHTMLSGYISKAAGHYEDGVDEASKAIELDPDFGIGYYNLAVDDAYLNHFNEADNVIRSAEAHGLELDEFLMLEYDIAFVRNDLAALERVAAKASGRPGGESWISNNEAFVLAYSGHLQQARTTSRRAIDYGLQEGEKERAGLFEAGTAVREALFGNASEAKKWSGAALSLSRGRAVEYGTAFAFALSGEATRAQVLADDLKKRFPEDTAVQFSYLPVLRAELALDHHDAAKAIEFLQVAVPNELGASLVSFGALYPVYVRGEALLALRQGAQAAVEFQKILDHPGIVVSDPVGAAARFQLGTAYALVGNKTMAKAAFNDFLTVWKDADPDIPMLKQAESEFARLQ